MRSLQGLETKPFLSYPCLCDRVGTTPVADLHYFYQDTWGASQIVASSPKTVVDIGSSGQLLAIVSQFIPVVSIDIRPLTVSVPNLTSRRGSILALPFRDESVEFLMSLCVIEHIGLGRYGDPLDPLGFDKACVELSRVIRPGGRLVVSVPVGPPCIAFNAHQVFTREEFLQKFPGFIVEEEIFCNPQYTDHDPTPSKTLGEVCLYLRAAGKNMMTEVEEGWCCQTSP